MVFLLLLALIVSCSALIAVNVIIKKNGHAPDVMGDDLC
jgi:hypothetical protein